MKKIIGIIAFSAIMLTSCQTLMQTSRNISTGSSINSVTLADLNVSDTRESHTIEHVTKAMQSGGEENVKRIAEAKILEKANADILVEPRYHIVKERRLFGGSKITSITVSGRPANFTNFRQVEDSILFRPEKVYITEKEKAHAPMYYKKKSGAKYAMPVAKNNNVLNRKRYLSAGFGFSASDEVTNAAYNVSFGAWNPISKNKRWQYGFEIGFSSQGFEDKIKEEYRYYDYYWGRYYYEYYYNYTAYLIHNIHILPARIAYMHEMGRNSSLGLHFAPLITIAYASSGKELGDFSELFNVGIKGGLQYRYKKFMFDVNVQTGFLSQWSYYSMPQTSFTLNFGYMF